MHGGTESRRGEDMSTMLRMEGIDYMDRCPAPGTDPNSLFFVRINKETCVGCSSCQAYCPTGAVWGSSGQPHEIRYKELCINCGQCLVHCPSGSIYETQSWVGDITTRLQDGRKKVIAMPAPAVRYALGECFGMEPGSLTTGKMLSAFRALGFAHCWDNEFGADMTIWEEGHEFVKRFTRQLDLPLPQFTSCCPSWHKYVETWYPDLLPHLSSAKSPIGMLGALCKSYGAQANNYRPEDVYTVAIMPCISKKYEGLRPELRSSGGPDIDATINTRELAYMMKKAGIDLRTLPEGDRDPLMGESSGGATLFCAPGGVMEAALRFAYQSITGAPPSSWDFKQVRGLDGIREAEVQIGDQNLRVAVVQGAKHFKAVCDTIREGNAPWQFVEFMSCPGGCVNGGGQPVMPGVVMKAQRATSRFMTACRDRLQMMAENRKGVAS